jgi:hypothetical protein
MWDSQNVAIALKKIFLGAHSMSAQQTREAFRKECEVQVYDALSY